MYSNVNEYISYLIENQSNINITEFVKKVNEFEFKININFIEDFIELVKKNVGFHSIHHNMLKKYGISSLKDTTNYIKKMLEQNKFKENKDYQMRNVCASYNIYFL